MPEAYIVDAVRSPTGRRKGGLAHVHGADLGAHVLKAIVERNGIPDNEYDDVIFGCVDTIGPLAYLLVTSPHPLSFGRCGGGLVVLPSLSIRPAIQVCLCVLNHTSHLLWQRYGEAKTV